MRILFLLLFTLLSSLSFSEEKKMEYRSDYYMIAAKALADVCPKIAKEENLFYLCSGLGELVHKCYSPWGVVFTCKEKLTPEQAQALAKKVQNRLLEIAYKTPAFKTYYDLSAKEGTEKKEFTPSQLVLKIAFWDEEVNRPQRPYTADVRIFEDKIHCFYANPITQALEDPVIVPFNPPPPS